MTLFRFLPPRVHEQTKTNPYYIPTYPREFSSQNKFPATNRESHYSSQERDSNPCPTLEPPFQPQQKKKNNNKSNLWQPKPNPLDQERERLKVNKQLPISLLEQHCRDPPSLTLCHHWSRHDASPNMRFHCRNLTCKLRSPPSSAANNEPMLPPCWWLQRSFVTVLKFLLSF